MKRQKDEWLFRPEISLSSTKTCTEGVCAHHSSSAFPEMMVNNSSMRSIQGCVHLISAQELW
jgi:hypothetical protein